MIVTEGCRLPARKIQGLFRPSTEEIITLRIKSLCLGLCPALLDCAPPPEGERRQSFNHHMLHQVQGGLASQPTSYLIRLCTGFETSNPNPTRSVAQPRLPHMSTDGHFPYVSQQLSLLSVAQITNLVTRILLPFLTHLSCWQMPLALTSQHIPDAPLPPWS